MGISQGKLALYVAAGGVQPKATLPVCLECVQSSRSLSPPLELLIVAFFLTQSRNRQRSLPIGSSLRRSSQTSNWRQVYWRVRRSIHEGDAQELPQHDHSIWRFRNFKGFPHSSQTSQCLPLFQWRHSRNRESAYATSPFSNLALIEFATQQGAVVLAGAIRAFQLTGIPLKDQRILFFGAGSSVSCSNLILRFPLEQLLTLDMILTFLGCWSRRNDYKVLPDAGNVWRRGKEQVLACRFQGKLLPSLFLTYLSSWLDSRQFRVSSLTIEETSSRNTSNTSLVQIPQLLVSLLSSKSSSTSNPPLSSVSVQ